VSNIDFRTTAPQPPRADQIPSALTSSGAMRFWLAVVLTGIGTGVGAAALTRLLQIVQRLMWGGSGTDILDAATRPQRLYGRNAAAGEKILNNHNPP